MILLDVSHTCHTASQSGIQQVCRNLYLELSKQDEVVPIVYDPFAKRFRTLDKSELSLLNIDSSATSSKKRGAKWSNWQKVRGYALSLINTLEIDFSQNIDAILVPEIPSPKIPVEAYIGLRSKTGAKLHAVFHDAIALRMPEITPKKTVEYFPKYLETLARFDKIASVSKASKADLLHFWNSFGISSTPPVITIPLGGKIPHLNKNQPQHRSPKAKIDHHILFVGSIEGRKNHLEALKAVESLWAEGYTFSLTLIGGSVPETAQEALTLIKKLETKKYPINWLGPVDEERLKQAYQECTFTLYPSLLEGFGLPPIESISYGKACVCTDAGGLAETTQGGGCLIIPGKRATDIADSLVQILNNTELFQKLTAEAIDRPLRTWEQYSTEIRTWFTNC